MSVPCCATPRITSATKATFGAGKSCARSSDLEPTRTPTPPRRPGSTQQVPPLRQRKRDLRCPAHMMPPTPVLQTPRLVLRPVRSKDAPGHPAPLPAMGDRALARRQACPGPIRPTAPRAYVATCLERDGAGREVAIGRSCPKDGPAELIGMHRPVARRRREPRPARLLARSRLPGPGPDDRGGRPGDRLRLPRARLAATSGSAMRRTTTPRAGSRRSRARGWST